MTAFDELITVMAQGRNAPLFGEPDKVRALLDRVYEERCHNARHHRDAYQLRVNLQKKEDAASYAGWITADNPSPRSVTRAPTGSSCSAKTWSCVGRRCRRQSRR